MYKINIFCLYIVTHLVNIINSFSKELLSKDQSQQDLQYSEQYLQYFTDYYHNITVRKKIQHLFKIKQDNDMYWKTFNFVGSFSNVGASFQRSFAKENEESLIAFFKQKNVHTFFNPSLKTCCKHLFLTLRQDD